MAGDGSPKRLGNWSCIFLEFYELKDWYYLGMCIPKRMHCYQLPFRLAFEF